MDTFSDLPDALVRDLLAQAQGIALAVEGNLSALADDQQRLRQLASESGLVRRKSDLTLTREPSVVGIDGSYNARRLTATDLCAAAALGVEGVVRAEKRLWPEPYHRFWAGADAHTFESPQLLRGLMVLMELDLVSEAPHELVLMDGSFLSLIIYLNQALSVLSGSPCALKDELDGYWSSGGLSKLNSVLESGRTVSIPKFTSRNELATYGVRCREADFDARTLATFFLEPGEYTKPLPLVEDSEPPYHLSGLSRDENDALDQTVRRLSVVFFRPHPWAPAMRVECPPSIANSDVRLSRALEGLERQVFSPAVLEPYPLFLADRMVKSLGAGLAAIEHTVAQQVAATSKDLERTMLCMQNYRTEGGR